jgi:hypothetical protein
MLSMARQQSMDATRHAHQAINCLFCSALWCRRAVLLIAADAHKSGVAQEAVNKAVKTASGMSTQEARMILSVDPTASWLDVTKVSNKCNMSHDIHAGYGCLLLFVTQLH